MATFAELIDMSIAALVFGTVVSVVLTLVLSMRLLLGAPSEGYLKFTKQVAEMAFNCFMGTVVALLIKAVVL